MTRHGLLLLLSALALNAQADGSAIDKVYHPYVEPLERELEWRMTVADKDPQSGDRWRQLHRLGLGRAIAETVFAEVYLIAADSAEDEFALEAYELELLWQMTEQGEYAVDVGTLFELEREHGEDAWETRAAVLLEKELGRFSGTANIGLVYEWGDGIEDEWETQLALQARYRLSPLLEPALEFYAGEDSLGAGPALQGFARLGIKRGLRWEAGIILGLDRDTPDYTLRTSLEYEF